MNTKVARFFIFFTALIYLILLLFGWMHANVDSYFYFAIGQYFRTGVYPFTSPFIYTKPTTISPPLYGVFFILTHTLPAADILLHAIQLLLLAATSFLLYTMLCLQVKKSTAVVVSCLFALLPVNIVYAGSVMTENPAQFLVTLWTFLIIWSVVKKQTRYIGIAMIVAAVAALTKYSLAIYMPLAGIFLLPRIPRLKPIEWMTPAAAVAILLVWVVINHNITGVWGLYDTKGTQLYNQFVAQTKLLPPETDPAVIRMRQLLPPGTDIAVPYWDIQEGLGRSLHGVWRDIDTVLFNVAWGAVRSHPIAYLTHSVANFARMHYDNLPHWRNIGNIGVTGLTGTDVPYCSGLDAVHMCTPAIPTPWSYPLWNAYIHAELWLFRIIAPLFFYLVILPSLLISLVWGNTYARLYAATYLVGVVPIAFTIHVDPRYIVPFYGLIVLVVISALQIVWRKTEHLFR